MKKLSFKLISEEDYKEIENDFENSNYFQTSNWGQLKEMTGWSRVFVGVYDGSEFLAISMLLYKNILFGKKIFYSPRGILCDYNSFDILDFFTKEVNKYIKSMGGFLLKIDPLVSFCERDLNGLLIGDSNNLDLINYLKSVGFKHNGFTTGFSDDVQFRWSFYLDIVEKEKIIQDMDKRCRRSIRRSDKYPYIIKEVDDDSIMDFKVIMEHTCSRHSCYDRSLDYYRQIKHILKDRAKLLIIYLLRDEYLSSFKDDKLYDIVAKEDREFIPVTAGVFIIDKNFVHYVYGGTIKEYMRLCFQYKLQFLMINYAISNNISVYDFGGISGVFDKDSSDYGIYEFKRGFGGYVVEYIGEFDLIVDKKYYYLYKLMYSVYGHAKRIILNLKKKLRLSVSIIYHIY